MCFKRTMSFIEKEILVNLTQRSAPKVDTFLSDTLEDVVNRSLLQQHNPLLLHVIQLKWQLLVEV